MEDLFGTRTSKLKNGVPVEESVGFDCLQQKQNLFLVVMGREGCGEDKFFYHRSSFFFSV